MPYSLFFILMCQFNDMLELVQRSQLPKPSDHTELALPLLLLFRASTATAAQNEISQLILWALFKIAPVAALLPPVLPWANCFYCTNTQGPKEFQMRCPGSCLQPSYGGQFSTHLAASYNCQALSFLPIGELGTRGNLFHYWFTVLYLSKRYSLMSIILLLFPI